ncbi:MAG: ATP-binding protein, partial [Betaproteobacteria bacterium]|nr:ATP-binding protein [Betaproteobacteria bacterium]
MRQRHLESLLREALADTPVVLLVGARQTGKTTLARKLCEALGGQYASLDDAATLAGAAADPAGFVRARAAPFVIDEVQAAPALLRAIKQAVDADRRPGRFLLTGSADVLALPKVSESLAGRMEVRTLWPLSQGEIHGRTEGFLGALFGDGPWRSPRARRTDLARLVAAGGYPELVARENPRRRDAWFASYVTAILQRDVRDLARIEGLIEMPRLLALLAARSSALMNMSELSRASAIPQTTLKRYLALLELTWLLRPLPAWSTNRSKRLVKAPKIHLVDSGLAVHLAGFDTEALARDRSNLGPLLETFVVGELTRQASWTPGRTHLFHFRTSTGREVDVVLEGPGGKVAGVEVKASAVVSASDFAGLHALAEAAGRKFAR